MSTEKTLDERWSDMSDQYLKDAANEGQSMHGRCTCAFDAGYFAVLRSLDQGSQYKYKYEHPDIAVLRDVGALSDGDIGLALKFLTHRYEAPELMPSLDELLAWTHKMRALAEAKRSVVAWGHSERARLRAMVEDGLSSGPARPDIKEDWKELVLASKAKVPSAMASPTTVLVMSDPEIMNGSPVFAGTRVPVDNVLASLAVGIDMSRIRDSYPFLTDAHLQAARAYVEAHPQPSRPMGVGEAHPDWKVTETGVLRGTSTDNLPLRLSELTPELVARIVEESVGAASDEESTTLSSWCNYEARLAHTPNTLSRHLVGWAEEAHEGRTSSAVVQLDAGARTARTESGRLYRLRGKPGLGGDAHHVWNQFVRSNGATDIRDITDEVFSLMAQLGMSEGGDIAFEPPKARFESPPPDLDDGDSGVPAEDAILGLMQAPCGGLDSGTESDSAVEAEHAGTVLLKDAIEGLEDVTAVRVLDEAALDALLSADTPESWLAENKDALESSNEFVGKNGLPLGNPKDQ